MSCNKPCSCYSDYRDENSEVYYKLVLNVFQTARKYIEDKTKSDTTNKDENTEIHRSYTLLTFL